MDKTYQRGDLGEFGVIAKVSPMHLKKKGSLDKNTVKCWYREEDEWSTRRGQTVIPYNLSKFEVCLISYIYTFLGSILKE